MDEQDQQRVEPEEFVQGSAMQRAESEVQHADIGEQSEVPELELVAEEKVEPSEIDGTIEPEAPAAESSLADESEDAPALSAEATDILDIAEALAKAEADKLGDAKVSESTEGAHYAEEPKGTPSSHHKSHLLVFFLKHRLLVVLGAALIALFIALGRAGVFSSLTAREELQVEPISANTEVEVRETMNEYSWDELATISAKISQAEDRDDALAIAYSFGLCTDELTLDPGAYKELTLADGTKARAQLIGIYHDERSDGEGYAGLSFLLVASIGEGPVYAVDAPLAGWETSDLREEVQTDGLALLPEELCIRLVEVNKYTNNKGGAATSSDVTATPELVWPLSHVEIVGLGRREAYEAAGVEWNENRERLFEVLNLEGTHYELFEARVIERFSENECLTMSFLPEDSSSGQWERYLPSPWWTRSAYVGDDIAWIYVNEEGRPGQLAEPSESLGWCIGFCI